MDKGFVPAYEDLFDVLWESDANGSLDEMAGFVDYFVARGEGWAYRLLGRMCRHGVGVEKSLEKAEEYTRMALDMGVEKALPDLCDLLLDIGTRDSVKEMKSLASKYAEFNEPWALNRIANARLKGRGTRKDVDAGIRLHLKAVSFGSAESARDLFDYARSKKDKELIGRIVAAMLPFAERGDPDCMMRFGRMCLEGYGMRYDRGAAIEWMKAAAMLRREYRQEYESLMRSGHRAPGQGEMPMPARSRAARPGRRDVALPHATD